jgi:hypothetical protein
LGGPGLLHPDVHDGVIVAILGRWNEPQGRPKIRPEIEPAPRKVPKDHDVLAARDRLAAMDDRTDLEKFLGVPPRFRSALFEKRQAEKAAPAAQNGTPVAVSIPPREPTRAERRERQRQPGWRPANT